LNNLEKIYLCTWIIYVILALINLYVRKETEILFSKNYLKFLKKPWKLTTFLISGLFITLIGPYTSDPTWDFINGGIMSVLTFWTAPWAAGMIYKILIRKFPIRLIFPVSALWFFSASWSYDLYLVIRDGFYPDAWFSNLLVSSVIYLSAGLMWNLDYEKSRGIFFSFTQDTWPQVNEGVVLHKIIWIAIPFMLIAFYLTASLVEF